MASFLLAIEPFWGRAIIYDVKTKEETEFSIQLVLSNNYAASYLEAVNLFCDLKKQLEEKSTTNFSICVIEVTEAQSDETQQAVLTAAKNSGFKNAQLVLYENTRLLWALKHLSLDPNVKHENITVAVVDIWQNEAFGYLLKLKKNSTSGILNFKPCGYYAVQSESEDGFEICQLKKFAQKLCHNQKIKTALISSGDYDNECHELFPDPIFYDADERRGTLLKAIVLFYEKFVPSPQTDNLHINVLETLEYSLKLIIADQKHTIAEAYDELPINFEKVITVDKPINTLEFCRQWSSSSMCESYGRTSFNPKNVVKIKCSVDKLQKIDLKIE